MGMFAFMIVVNRKRITKLGTCFKVYFKASILICEPLTKKQGYISCNTLSRSAAYQLVKEERLQFNATSYLSALTHSFLWVQRELCLDK